MIIYFSIKNRQFCEKMILLFLLKPKYTHTEIQKSNNEICAQISSPIKLEMFALQCNYRTIKFFLFEFKFSDIDNNKSTNYS